jgi:hypothetical protein
MLTTHQLETGRVTTSNLTLQQVAEVQESARKVRHLDYYSRLFDACELAARWMESNTARDAQATDAAFSFIAEHLHEELQSQLEDEAQAAACEL